MSTDAIDISGLLDWEEELPRPKWELIQTLVEEQCAPETQYEVWVSIARQWLDELCKAFDAGYEIYESKHFLALASRADGHGPALMQFAEGCRAMLLSVLGDVAAFMLKSKQVVVTLRDSGDYYRYLGPFYSEGEHGGSAGIHIREGYPHVALYSGFLDDLQRTLAHELTHAALMHLSMPQWIEEGLAQMFEHDMTERALLMVDAEMAREHKQYWGKHGMDAFWYGEGFSRSGTVQKLSYQLAEILMRLLVEEGRPRWFGWVKEPQRRFFAFLREASAGDCGRAACEAHLGCGLCDVAARFLGDAASDPGL